MDEIDFGGEKYIASKKAAKMVGYTNDYVGQMCREGRVNCRRIGREWYVNEKSLLQHKKSNQSKKKSSDKSDKGDIEKRRETVLNATGNLYYKKDKGPLQPTPQKKKKESAVEDKISEVKVEKGKDVISKSDVEGGRSSAMDIQKSQRSSSAKKTQRTSADAKYRSRKAATQKSGKKKYKKKTHKKPLKFFMGVIILLLVFGVLFVLIGSFVGSEVRYSSQECNIEKTEQGYDFSGVKEKVKDIWNSIELPI